MSVVEEYKMMEQNKTIALYERLIEEQNKVIVSLTNIIKNPYIIVTDDKGNITQTINQLEAFRRGL